MRTCERCGGPAYRGWTDGNKHDRCAACEVAGIPELRLHRHALPYHTGACACCGKEGSIVGHGLRKACYERRRRHGMLAEWRAFYRG